MKEKFGGEESSYSPKMRSLSNGYRNIINDNEEEET